MEQPARGYQGRSDRQQLQAPVQAPLGGHGSARHAQHLSGDQQERATEPEHPHRGPRWVNEDHPTSNK